MSVIMSSVRADRIVKIMELYDLGYSDAAIQYATKITKNTVCNWRNKHNLPAKTAITEGMLKQREREAQIQQIACEQRRI